MGGNAFKEIVNSHIPKHLLNANVQMALLRLGLENVKYSVVGNTNKEEFGDIDIALDELSLASRWNILPNELWEQLPTKLENQGFTKSKYMIVKGWRQFHVCVPLVGLEYDRLGFAYCNNHWTNESNPYIQVDFMVGNIPWMEKVLGPADNRSEWKPLYRTNLITDLVNSTRVERGPGLYTRLFMDHKVGVFADTHEVTKPKGLQKVDQDKTVARRVITNNPDELARMMFGPFCVWNDINCFENVFEHIKDKIEPELTKRVFEKFKTRLEKEKLTVPKVISSSIG